MRKALILAIVVLTVMAPTAAWAGPPQVVFEATEVISDDVPAGEICDFEIHIEETVKVRVTAFFDKDGNLAREVGHVNGTTYWTTDAGAVTEHWNNKFTFAADELTVTIVGNSWNGHTKGQGIVINDSGRVIIDLTTDDVIFDAGPHQAGEGDFGDFCAVLAP